MLLSGFDTSERFQGLVRELYRLPAIDGVTLHLLDDATLALPSAKDWNNCNLGWCFLEHPITSYRFVPAACKAWDQLIAGSQWHAHHLSLAGAREPLTILPGFDGEYFFPTHDRPDTDVFTIFSGGQFSYQNGHDLVVRSLARFMARHRDVRLVYQWQFDAAGLSELQQRGFMCDSNAGGDFFTSILQCYGIDPERCIAAYSVPAAELRQLYAGTDMGLFPVRSLANSITTVHSYMACGRAAIVPARGPYTDLFTPACSYPLAMTTSLLAQHDTVVWFEPEVDVILERLEQAYGDRAGLLERSAAAGQIMTAFSWATVAAQLHELAVKAANAMSPAQQARTRQGSMYGLRGVALLEAGCFEAAQQEIMAGVRAEPRNPELYNALGNLMDAQQRYDEALLYFDKALAIQPDFAVAWFNKGNTYKRMECYDAAIEAYREHLKLQPDFVRAWLNLGFALEKQEQPEQAEQCYRQAMELAPDEPDAFFFLANQLYVLKRYEEAISCLGQALSRDDSLFLLWNLLGLITQAQGDYRRSIEAYRRALQIRPDYAPAFSNLGVAYRSLVLLEEAITCCRQAVRLDPAKADSRWNLSIALLHAGQYEEGWQEYEWRWQKDPPTRRGHTDKPLWGGEPLSGKTILVHCEQGYGDTLQFVRFIPILAQQGARVVFECNDASLKELLSRVEGIAEIYARGEALPPVDFQITVMSLPWRLRIGLQDIPGAAGYLRADPAKRRLWKSVVQQSTPPAAVLRVGIVWAGNKVHGHDHYRSVAFEQLQPLLQVPRIAFYSLQLGERGDEATADARLINLTSHIQSFDDTAALISNLDLVISVDSAVAHLAGAMGVPVWILVAAVSDWRWLRGRTDSPWYTAATIFRQERINDWAPVISRCCDRLEKIVKNS